jgi:hypothetical protein
MTVEALLGIAVILALIGFGFFGIGKWIAGMDQKKG